MATEGMVTGANILKGLNRTYPNLYGDVANAVPTPPKAVRYYGIDNNRVRTTIDGKRIEYELDTTVLHYQGAVSVRCLSTNKKAHRFNYCKPYTLRVEDEVSADVIEQHTVVYVGMWTQGDVRYYQFDILTNTSADQGEGGTNLY